jgi:hypothetical protein
MTERPGHSSRLKGIYGAGTPGPALARIDIRRGYFKPVWLRYLIGAFGVSGFFSMANPFEGPLPRIVDGKLLMGGSSFKSGGFVK